ncbi:ribosome maturation factor RimM [Haloechinothrix sp. LS1_15]|uniref:ribosome maturation factor RimM n=1 Tax=Haloechinothrix sp. LS1_15 TaxID=2652248 RepID=UPI00294640F6|nr:ribosome maturation factor RimM [Haloechinothrix sp. LS1_15]MDV6012808.1 ribosome maturation factor RimM [Haloechinothrix sp. LS1_15]
MEVVVGRVAKAHGVRGELAVDVRTDAPDERFADGAVLAVRRTDSARVRPSHGRDDTHRTDHSGSVGDDGPRTLTVAQARPHGQRLLIRFEEVTSREAADRLRGCLLVVDTADLPPPEDPDEFHDHQLIGLDVGLTDGSSVGSVRDVVHGPGSDLLVVATGDREVLVPFVHAIVPVVDLDERRIVLDPPEGLLE